MGASARYDFDIEQGVTFDRLMTWRDAAGSLMSLTGYTAVMQIREKIDSASVIATSAGTSPPITLTLGGAAGTIQIKMTNVITAAFTFESAVYDLELTKTSSGQVIRLLEGDMFLIKEVTR